MGGFGVVLAGIQAMRNNRAMLSKRKKGDISFVAKKEKWVDHKSASPELLEEIRNKIVREQKIRRRRVLVTTLVIAAIIIGGLIYVMNR